ncbi:MAG: hypothetical protein R2867_13155 [Caldilineaceae bacterium]
MATPAPPAGYSKRPLAQKLGIKHGHRVAILQAPDGYRTLLELLPDAVTWHDTLVDDLDLIHYFTDSRQALAAIFPALKAAIRRNGMIWISWPKKASKVSTDLDDALVREMGLHQGLVDVKVAAIDHVWSGLKFVYRTRDR